MVREKRKTRGGSRNYVLISVAQVSKAEGNLIHWWRKGIRWVEGWGPHSLSEFKEP